MSNKKAETLDTTKKTTFEEVEIRITEETVNGQVVYSPEKLKVLRSGVKITPDQAHILNAGVVGEHNKYASMYYLPGEDQPYANR